MSTDRIDKKKFDYHFGGKIKALKSLYDVLNYIDKNNMLHTNKSAFEEFISNEKMDTKKIHPIKKLFLNKENTSKDQYKDFISKIKNKETLKKEFPRKIFDDIRTFLKNKIYNELAKIHKEHIFSTEEKSFAKKLEEKIKLLDKNPREKENIASKFLKKNEIELESLSKNFQDEMSKIKQINHHLLYVTNIESIVVPRIIHTKIQDEETKFTKKIERKHSLINEKGEYTPRVEKKGDETIIHF